MIANKRSANFIIAAAAFVVAAPLAVAHAHLRASTPASGSNSTTAPTALTLQFSEPVRVTALSIESASLPATKLAPLPAQTSDSVRVPLPTMSPGTYDVKWRALGTDGHVTTGQLKFTISAAASPIAAKTVTLPLIDGEVRKIDTTQRTITLRHGAIPNLDMAGMTMVFAVKDPAWLQAYKVGDKLRFSAERPGGVLTIVAVEAAALAP